MAEKKQLQAVYLTEIFDGGLGIDLVNEEVKGI